MRSEAELDSQLAALKYHVEHETITLNEEKKALATMKKLEQQRELGSAPKREVTLLQEVTTGTCCAQNCECG